MAVQISGYVYYSVQSYTGVKAPNGTSNLPWTTESAPDLKQITIQPPKPVSGVAIVLRDSTTKQGVCIKTSDAVSQYITNPPPLGQYIIKDVPAGSYELFEAFGETNFVTQTFVDATTKISVEVPLSSITYNAYVQDMSQAVPADPTVSHISAQGNPTFDASRIVSISRNMYKMTVTESAATVDTPLAGSSFYFYDAPTKYIPIGLDDYYPIGANMIIQADHGTFGELPFGTREGIADPDNPTAQPYTNPAPETPREQITTDEYITQCNFVPYSATQPDSTDETTGERGLHAYSICNILNQHTFKGYWFDTADHTFGDERGRMAVINGDLPGTYFFNAKADLEAGCAYVFSAWIMNATRLKGGVNPYFKVEVRDSAQGLLYQTYINDNNKLEVSSIPTWAQLGAVIPADKVTQSGEASIIFYSMAEETIGNDYIIDDVRLRKLVTSPPMPDIKKWIVDEGQEAIENTALFDEAIDYKVVFTNGSEYLVQDCTFIDMLPIGATLVGSRIRVQYDDISFEIPIGTETLTDEDFVVTDTDYVITENITEILKTMVPEDHPYYEQLKLGQIPPLAAGEPYNKLIITYTVKVADIDSLETKDILYDTSSMNYAISADLSYSDYPRSVTSNRVKTNFLYPELAIHKGASKLVKVEGQEEPQEQSLSPGEKVLSGTKMVYVITLTNKGLAYAENVEVTDKLDDMLIPACQITGETYGIKISQIPANPSVPTPAPLIISCDQIQNYIIDDDMRDLKITGIIVPPAFVNEQGELIEGKTEIRIYATADANQS